MRFQDILKFHKKGKKKKGKEKKKAKLSFPSLAALRHVHHAKWFLVFGVTLVVGVVIIVLGGRIFISEVVQDVELVPQNGESSTGAALQEQAPFWELPDEAGNVVALTDFLDEPLVLTFWASWNTMSADQLKIFDDYASQEGETLFRIVALNNQEDHSIVSNFLRRGGYTLRVVLDESGSAGESYQVRTLPITYFIDREGIIRDVFIGILSRDMLVEKAEKIVR